MVTACEQGKADRRSLRRHFRPSVKAQIGRQRARAQPFLQPDWRIQIGQGERECQTRWLDICNTGQIQ